jgi:hypothetical protein
LIHLRDKNGFAYTNEVFNVIQNKFGINRGVFFISACRAEFFKNRVSNTYDIVDLHPIRRNCGDISYDLCFVNELISQHPESIESLTNVKKRLEVRDRRKKEIDLIISQEYLQNTAFYNNNFIDKFYSFLSATSGEINLCINFSKIKIISNIDNTKYTDSLIQIVNNKFYEFRLRLQNRSIIESNNLILYTKLGFIYRFIFNYVKKFNKLPSKEIFENFWNFVELNWNNDKTLDENKTQINIITNNYSHRNFSFSILRGNNISIFQNKYLKYKKKYLELKKNIY